MSAQAPGELQQRLSFLEQLNPNRIELGLDRVRAVLERLALDFGQAVIIEAAGTNGKGSTCALIDAALRAAGYTSCLYTSPHLHRFNERVVINGREAGDEALCEAFDAVKAAAGEIFLTYFEYATLAAFYLFAKAKPDALVLEIGLGGRLDAVNVLDADIAVITSIGLDHVHILGHTEAEIAAEKAGIIKPHAQVVCGLMSGSAQAVIAAKAQEQGAELWLEGRDFAGAPASDAQGFVMQFTNADLQSEFNGTLPHPLVPEICVPAAVMTLQLLRRRGMNIPRAALEQALRTAVLPGRMQLLSRQPDIYLDVAHNEPAARHLAQVLQARKLPAGARRLGVIGMLRDKDVESVLALLSPLFSHFYLCSLPGERGERAERLKQALLAAGTAAEAVTSFDTAAEALQAARAEAADIDEIVVCGSFVTVGLADEALKNC